MVPKDPPASVVSADQDHAAIPVATMVESIVGCKWSVGLLRLLADGPSRPSAMLRNCPRLSAKVMNERLRKMMRYGIVRRSVFGDKPPIEVTYTLTGFGRRFIRILDEVRRLQEAVDSTGMPGSASVLKDAPRMSRRRKPTARTGSGHRA